MLAKGYADFMILDRDKQCVVDSFQLANMFVEKYSVDKIIIDKLSEMPYSKNSIMIDFYQVFSRRPWA